MKTRREEVTQKYWDKMWADIEKLFAEVNEMPESGEDPYEWLRELREQADHRLNELYGDEE